MLKKNNFFNKLTDIRFLLRNIGFSHHFQIHACSNLTVPPKWAVGPKTNKDFHIVMSLGGRGEYVVDNKKIPLHRGRIIFISNGIEYSANQDLKNPPHIIPVRFYTYNNSDNITESILNSLCAISHVTANIEKFQDMFESLHRQHLLNRGEFRTAYCSMMIQHILSDLLFECLESSKVNLNNDNRITKVQQFIASSPLDRSSVIELANKALLSEKYFSRMFKKQVGVSPKRYQLNSRLHHAKDLLYEGCSVKETAFELGYNDPFVFSKQFKMFFGISPVNFNQSKLN
jgi:AraC-like DNA-binding protein